MIVWWSKQRSKENIIWAAWLCDLLRLRCQRRSTFHVYTPWDGTAAPNHLPIQHVSRWALYRIELFTMLAKQVRCLVFHSICPLLSGLMTVLTDGCQFGKNGVISYTVCAGIPEQWPDGVRDTVWRKIEPFFSVDVSGITHSQQPQLRYSWGISMAMSLMTPWWPERQVHVAQVGKSGCENQRCGEVRMEY